MRQAREIAIEPSKIQPFRSAARDYWQTEELKGKLQKLRAERKPLLLGFAELDLIFKWKLERQYGRNAHQRICNTEEEYRAITLAAFTVTRSDASEEAAKRLRILMCLDGVGIGVASAILALTEPARYCVIDFRGWRALYNLEKRAFSVTDYLDYRADVERLSLVLGWSVQSTGSRALGLRCA